jgi:cysteinyl-tRNA synthetase
MSTKYLGETFDIHGGGMDLKFPHHECEIAQGCASTGKSPVNYWMHGNMLTLNGKKMSKSTGNTLLPNELFNGGSDLLERGYHPMVVRFFMMQAHYRSTLDFTSDALNAAEKGFEKLMDAVKDLANLSTSESSSINAQGLVASFYDAMNDDFNAPILVANLFETVKVINTIKEGKATITQTDLEILTKEVNAFVFDVLGLATLSSAGDDSKLEGVMDLVLNLRQQARENKDWGTSDKIRDGLAAAGLVVKDGKDGTTWK